MKKVALEIVALKHSVAQTKSYAVVLAEVDGVRELSIVIGDAEARAIAIAIEHMPMPRPLTHDLLINMMDQFNIELKEVFIYKLEEGTFYAYLNCHQYGEEIAIDARTSDALAVAVRVNCPIFIDDQILKIASKKTKETKASEKTAQNPYAAMSTAELQAELDMYLENEEYDKAIPIRDEINRRNNQ